MRKYFVLGLAIMLVLAVSPVTTAADDSDDSEVTVQIDPVGVLSVFHLGEDDPHFTVDAPVTPGDPPRITAADNVVYLNYTSVVPDGGLNEITVEVVGVPNGLALNATANLAGHPGGGGSAGFITLTGDPLSLIEDIGSYNSGTENDGVPVTYGMTISDVAQLRVTDADAEITVTYTISAKD